MLDVMLVTPTVLVRGDRLGEMEERRLSAMMLRFKDFADKCGGGDNHFSLGVDADSEQAGDFQMVHQNGMGFCNGVLRYWKRIYASVSTIGLVPHLLPCLEFIASHRDGCHHLTRFR